MLDMLTKVKGPVNITQMENGRRGRRRGRRGHALGEGTQVAEVNNVVYLLGVLPEVLNTGQKAGIGGICKSASWSRNALERGGSGLGVVAQ
jgi:hypothetical protein